MTKNQPKNNYQGGAEDFKGYIRLSSNENNEGPSSRVKATLKNNVNFSNIYPELDGATLRNQISKTYSLNSEQIILGAGSDEVLQMIYAAFTKPGDEVLFTKYAFAMYAIYAKNFKCKPKIFNDLKLQFSLNEFAKLASSKTKIIFLANPNNPTGSIFYKDEIIKFIKKINKKTLIVLDSAYCEYLPEKKYEDGLSLVKKFPNVIVTRSFSKIYALGGLRIGWGYSSIQNILKLYQFKKPFNVSRLSCVAATEALKDQRWISRIVKNNLNNKKYTINNLDNSLFKTHDTTANFILLEFSHEKIANKFVKFLYINKITVRHLASYRLPKYVRMTIGSLNEMKKTTNICNKFNV
jgi:histidinol-phosphate aminotransferase